MPAFFFAERIVSVILGTSANHSAGVAFAGRCGGEVYVTGADVELRAVRDADLAYLGGDPMVGILLDVVVAEGAGLVRR